MQFGSLIFSRLLSGCNLDTAAAMLLSRAISVAGNLESLDLSENRCGDQGTMAICRALKGNSRLLKLNLRQNEIGVRGGKEIGEMLASSDLRLRKLNVSWNSIKGSGAAAMFRGLCHNKFLHHLDASWNFFREESALELGNALAFNQALQHINLEHCGVSDVAAVRHSSLSYYCIMIPIPNLTVDKVLIAYGLRRNASIIYINLNMNPLGRNGAQALLRHQVIITALQYLFSLGLVQPYDSFYSPLVTI
jgi:Ran GTPase-activating protein (RanGAP) involved in mRNA processing and transport